MKILLAAVLLVGLSIIGLCFNIIFRKNGHFPETEISSNREMKKRGIRCAKEEEMRIWGKNRKGDPSCGSMDCGDCNACGLGKH